MKNRWVRLGGVLGIAYCVVGFFLIFLGWNGAASHDDVPAQFPYLISGGIAGLALVVVGSALMVAQSLRTDRVELRAAIEDLRTSVERSAVAGSATAVTAPAEAAAVTAPAAAAGGSLAPPLAGGGTVVAGPTSYHLPGCNLLEAQTDVTVISLAEAKASGRVPCRVCQPADTTEPAAEAS